ncbi:HAD family hydrolase [Roseibium sp. TrichSKD4]|nr:HAD family hydrolase [Roseibium sp. TrichSKD4]
MTIKHVVFDMGHILLHYDPELPFKRIIPDEAKRGFFFAKVCTTAWNEEQDKGRPWEEAEACPSSGIFGQIWALFKGVSGSSVCRY